MGKACTQRLGKRQAGTVDTSVILGAIMNKYYEIQLLLLYLPCREQTWFKRLSQSSSARTRLDPRKNTLSLHLWQKARVIARQRKESKTPGNNYTVMNKGCVRYHETLSCPYHLGAPYECHTKWTSPTHLHVSFHTQRMLAKSWNKQGVKAKQVRRGDGDGDRGCLCEVHREWRGTHLSRTAGELPRDDDGFE